MLSGNVIEVEGAHASRDAIAALTGLGWKPAIARRAVEQAARELPSDTPLEPLIRRALQRCN